MQHIYLTILFIFSQIGLLYFSVSIGDLGVLIIAIIALNAMALSLILAGRFSWIDRLLGGPEKSYNLHRFLGKTSLMAALLHWLTMEEKGMGIVVFLADVSAELGEFIIISMILLVTCSVIKLLPYHWWKRSHILMGPLYALALFHSIFAPSGLNISSAAGWSMIVLGVFALIGWLNTLKRGTKVIAKAEIIKITRAGDRLDMTLQRPKSLQWKAGQFAQLSLNYGGLKEHHPFTIASSTQSNELRFVIKQAGDYTGKLYKSAGLGQTVNIHEIAGTFLPQHSMDRNRQLWIAGGTGITPFLAALQSMKADNGHQVKLIYAIGCDQQQGILKQIADYQCLLPQLDVLLLHPGERLQSCDLSTIAASVQVTDLYLCGPAQLTQAARRSWHENVGIERGHVFEEKFDFQIPFTINKPLIQHLSKVFAKIPTYVKFGRRLDQLKHSVIQKINSGKRAQQ